MQYFISPGPHKNIITTYDVAFETAGFYVFSQEYAPLGDLTSNVSETGIGELHSKRVAKQVRALSVSHGRLLCLLWSSSSSAPFPAQVGSTFGGTYFLKFFGKYICCTHDNRELLLLFYSTPVIQLPLQRRKTRSGTSLKKKHV